MITWPRVNTKAKFTRSAKVIEKYVTKLSELRVVKWEIASNSC